MAAPGPNEISARLRERKQLIADQWEVAVRENLPPLRALDSHSMCDHLPEFLDALASWVEGDLTAARPGFDALADGHAVQRLGYGVDLETLTREYALLRSVLIRVCLAPAVEHAALEEIARLDEGLDEAILGAVRRYTRQRDSVRDRFIGILAHDLRNPLNTISIAGGALLSSDHSQRSQHKTATIILRSAERMTRMIDDVLELAREHLGGGIPISLAAGDLGEITREVVEELAAGHPDRDLAIEVSGNLEGFWDRDRVLQALSNVVANALQHGVDPIRVVVRETEDKRHIETIVSNHGKPPSPEEMVTMFDPFRAHHARKGGLGLGLYIVRAIARAHGAVTEVRPAHGEEGFCFVIVWPRTPSEEMPFRGTSPGTS
jgi:signal transduction histidine kinase